MAAPVFRNRPPEVALVALNGCPVTPILGLITGSAATSNSSTGTAFTMVAGQLYALQPDTACYIATGATSAAAVTAVTASSASVGGFKIDPAFGPTFYLALPGTDAFL